MILITFLILLACCHAKITMPVVYQDGMVMSTQEYYDQSFIGYTTCNQVDLYENDVPVAVILNIADNGEFRVPFNGYNSPSPKQYGSGWNYRFEDCDSTYELKNVSFGYTFLCGGQSNMAWPLRKTKNGKKALSEAKKYNNIRMYKADIVESSEPNLYGSGKWTGKVDEQFSALCYYTAVEFLEANPQMRNVPIGLYQVAKGGSSIQQWILKEEMDTLHCQTKNEIVDKKRKPGVYANGMIYPIRGLAFQRFLWYQGEANVSDYYNYACYLKVLLNSHSWSWPSRAKDTVIGLPGYMAKRSTPKRVKPKVQGKEITAAFRKEQVLGLLKNQDDSNGYRHWYFVNAVDLGSPKNIHPNEKLSIAKRIVYQWTNEYDGLHTDEWNDPYWSDNNNQLYTPQYTPGDTPGTYRTRGVVRGANGCRACCKKSSPVSYKSGRKWHNALLVKQDGDDFVWRLKNKKHRLDDVRFMWQSYVECVAFNPENNLPYLGNDHMEYVESQD